MLYVTTRNNQNIYTCVHSLSKDRSEDGGFFLPFKALSFSEEYLQSIARMRFGQRVAEVLNSLFRTTLSGWDIDFCVGRNPVRFEKIGHRIVVAETWHNLDWCYEHMEKKLLEEISPNQEETNWSRIGIRIAVLVGIWGDLIRQGISHADISVSAGDFSLPMSAWYARSWGLPIRNIIICCYDNNNLWNLICHGQLRTDMVAEAGKSLGSEIMIPDNLERLIYECGGTAEVERYLDCCRSGIMYWPTDAVAKKIREGMFVSIVGTERVESVIPNVYHSFDYLMTPASALAYAGLQDYRSKNAETSYAVMISDENPVQEADAVARALDISVTELKSML